MRNRWKSRVLMIDCAIAVGLVSECKHLLSRVNRLEKCAFHNITYETCLQAIEHVVARPCRF